MAGNLRWPINIALQ